MSWTAAAEVAADTSELGNTGAIMCGRCRATGLHPTAFAPLMGATIALGIWPLRGQGWAHFTSDRELVDELLEFGVAVLARHDDVVTLVTTILTRRATLLQWIAAAEDDDPIEAWWQEVADCNAALEVLDGVPRRLRACAQRIGATPAALGEAYAEVYRLVAAGRVMPHKGRWITGEGAVRLPEAGP